MPEQDDSAAPAIVKSRAMRCLLTGLLTAALVVGFVVVLQLEARANPVFLFVLTLAVGFCTAQVQERLMRQGDNAG